MRCPTIVFLFLSSAVSLPIVVSADDKDDNILDEIIVTATQEASHLKDIAASIGVINEAVMEDINATHSTDVLNRIPGVNVVQLGSTGQGTAAAIRQPVSYGPVYLYLENGVPTRSPAFFNHNALYEMNVAQGSGIEIIKGPGSALYGSDAIGGVVNVLTGKPPKEEKARLSYEGGEFGWQRGGFKGAWITDQHSFTARLDIMDVDGWREHTEFDRQSFISSWNAEVNGWKVNNVLTSTNIDMNTGGSGLRYDDYKNDSSQPGNLIGFRDVEALRFTSAIQKEFGDSLVSITPYYRSNDLAYIAHWTLNTGREVFIPWLGISQLDSQDAHVNNSGHDSLGVLFRYRKNTLDADAFWIAGVDVDFSDGYTKQTYIERTDDDPGVYWLSYQHAGLLYNYNVDFRSISPYLHYENRLTEQLKLSLGLRHDSVEYDYNNKLPTDLDDPIHKRPADTSVSMSRTSPKLGLVYQANEKTNLYFSYRNAFRIPSSGQLFRAGRNVDSTNLKPVVADSYEVGIRGLLTETIDYEFAYYYMVKEDDIVNITDETGARTNINAGETGHKGIEFGFDYSFTENLGLGFSYTNSSHTYKKWTESSTKDYSGNTMMNAPDSYTNIRMEYTPGFLNGGRVELEWLNVGEHYMNESNTEKYGGHDLVNLRGSYQLNDNFQFYVNVLNLTDELFAETTSKWGPTYTPGRPRTVFAGIKFDFN